jgi:D-alanyl-D-alanine dipeptidase
VLRRLAVAARALPEPYGLVVLDGWRPPGFQRELLAYYRDRYGGGTEGYVADPDDRRVVPPHVTGGAVDLTLSAGGVPLALGTDFDDFTERAHLAALEGRTADRLPAALRRLLARVLSAQGFAPYPLEWWHWSHGDQRWAAQHGLPRSRYAAVGAPPASSTAAASR